MIEIGFEKMFVVYLRFLMFVDAIRERNMKLTKFTAV